MALTYTELEAITNDYFMADGKKASDIYFKTSFLVDYFMKKQKGLWERPPGGEKVRVPLEYDEAEGGFYSRADPLSSDDREVINAAYFLWKHGYGNATIYRTDELKNAGGYDEVSMVTSKIASAQKTVTKWIAEKIYSAAGDSSVYLTGILAMCGETATVKYGNIAENDLVAIDGTKPWEGKTTTTTEALTLKVIRTLASSAKIHDGQTGKPDVGTTTETLFNIISGLLQVQQRFTEDTDTVKAGFLNLVFDGKIIAADDFIPSGYLGLYNSNHCGFAVHKKGYFARDKWRPLDGPAGRTMKNFFDGNWICNNRKAHACHSNLS